MWWLVLSAKRTTLSSMLGQYRGPVPSIWPEYIGARWRLARMIWWICSLVAPIQQWTCGKRGLPDCQLPISNCQLEEGGTADFADDAD